MLTVERGGPQPPNVPRRRRRPSRGIRSAVFDAIAVVAALALVGSGVLNLSAVGGPSLAAHQVAAGVAGLLVLAVLLSATLRWTRLRLLALLGWACYGVAVLLLLAVLVVGVQAYGARRWLAFGSFTFQPSELAKLGLLLVLADVLGSDRPAWRRFALAVPLALVPIGLAVLEPDLSTATLLTALTLVMLILGRVPARFLLPLFGGAVVVAPLAVDLLRPYQLARVHAFLSGSKEASGPGWAVLQAHIALASGGLFGRAHEPSHLLLAQYLPARQTDLALASLVEEWGLIAGAAVLVATAVLVWRVALASRGAGTRRASLVGAGLAVLLGVEAVVSLGGNLGLLPLAGVPFPLLSYGGTAAVVHLAALGVVLGIRRSGVRRRLWAAPRWRNPGPRLTRVTAFGLTGLLGAFALYGWQLQAGQGASLRHAGQVEMTRCVAVPAPRGVITDRHGTPLATDVPRDEVAVVPALLRRDPGAQSRLAGLLGRPVSQVQRAVTQAAPTALGVHAVRVATVPPSVAKRVAAAGIHGVMVIPSPRRVYPYGPLLAPVLGFVGAATPSDVHRWPGLPPNAVVGRAGIEEEYDPLLRGADGEQCVYVDPAGHPVAPGPHRNPVPGANLRLSLDLGLQKQLAADLAGGLRGKGDLGGAVAMDPRTGQVLAMASLPSYDDNLFGPPVDVAALRRVASDPDSPMLQHVTQVVAPPGSTFKLVAAAADVAHPVFAPGEVVPAGSSFTLGNHTFHNGGGSGPQNLAQAIAFSNDVYFYKLAWALGADRLTHVASELGVGRPTGVDLPGESAGYLGTPRSVRKIGATWYPGSTVILGIGQGYLDVTPLQNARWTAAVATGHRVTPRLGLAAGAGGNVTALPAPAPVRLPFAAALGPIRRGMHQATTVGTATLLGNLSVPVGAKTGTAEDPADPSGNSDSWLTAAAPLHHPSVVMTAFVRGGGEGAATAGPVVDQALQYFLAHKAQVLATPSAQRP